MRGSGTELSLPLSGVVSPIVNADTYDPLPEFRITVQLAAGGAGTVRVLELDFRGLVGFVVIRSVAGGVPYSGETDALPLTTGAVTAPSARTNQIVNSVPLTTGTPALPALGLGDTPFQALGVGIPFPVRDQVFRVRTNGQNALATFWCSWVVTNRFEG